MNRTVLMFLTTILLSLVFLMGLAFESRPAKADFGTIYIMSDGSVMGTMHILSADNVTYTFDADISGFLVVKKSDITIDGHGYTLQEPGNGIGINLSGMTNVTVQNVQVTAALYGIFLNSSSNIIVREDNLTANGVGINLIDSFDNRIQGNNFAENSESGITVASLSGNNSISENTFSDNMRGIYLSDANSNDVWANTLSSCFQDGIRLDYSSTNRIANNSVASSGRTGISLYNSSNFDNVLGNVITDCNVAITFRTFSSNNSVRENQVEGNFRGLEFISSPNNTIFGNVFTDSEWFNFRLARCTGNTVYENSIAGAWIDSSSANAFYHNYMGSYPLFTHSNASNAWDDGYPSGGNYWVGSNVSDASSGPDQNITGSDGICDSFIALDPYNNDRYPLAGPFISFNATSQVQIISNTSITNFQFNTTAISFSVNTALNTTGFCRIQIPTTLTNGTYTVFVNGIHVSYATLPDSPNYLYLTFDSSAREIVVLPEFSSFYVLVALLATILVVATLKKRTGSSASASVELK